MKTKIIFLLLIIFLIVITFFSACKDAIFYHISQEIEIVPPMIEGSPTNIVLFNGRVYVASGKKLYSYRNKQIDTDRKENWLSESPGIYIGQLAATEDYLYALCYDDNSAVIKRRDKSGQWEDALKNVDNTEYTIIQKIYSANNKLYIGAQKSNENEYAVHVMDSNGVLEERNFITGIIKLSLRGACFNGTDVFLCTGSGIYINDKLIEKSGEDFNGIITLPDNSTVVAITRKGSLFMVETAKLVDDPDNAGQQIEQPAVTKITNFSDGRYTTGAIALWQENASSANWLLLVGRTEIEYSTSTGHSYGYMELELSQTGGLDSEKTFTEPGKSDITTVQGYESYSSSMGAIPINSIYHVPIDIDDEMRIFASTQKDGVWSCKPVKSGGYGWNAETKN